MFFFKWMVTALRLKMEKDNRQKGQEMERRGRRERGKKLQAKCNPGLPIFPVLDSGQNSSRWLLLSQPIDRAKIVVVVA